MDAAITHNHFQLKKNVPDVRPGDRVKVHQKVREGNKERIQIFEGLVIKTQHGTGINGTFTVRRIASGVGVEKLFPLHSPIVTKIEKIRSAKVRRAKLYYVRGLIGKAAKRLKKEKEDLASWEDIIVGDDDSEKLEVKGEKEEIVENAEEAEIEKEKESSDTAKETGNDVKTEAVEKPKTEDKEETKEDKPTEAPKSPAKQEKTEKK